MILIFSACSSSKDDTNSIPVNSVRISSRDYLNDTELLSKLHATRERIFEDPRANIGSSETYAFDLYVNAGFAYRQLKQRNYDAMKSLLWMGQDVKWFFLSGGYGVIHALEPAVRYQATFTQGISYQKDIPFTGTLWKSILPKILDKIISKYNPEMTYVFGSRDYTWFIKQTQTWKNNDMIMLESTGSPGPHWLSPKVNGLVNHIIRGDLGGFNAQYCKFNKQ